MLRHLTILITAFAALITPLAADPPQDPAPPAAASLPAPRVVLLRDSLKRRADLQAQLAVLQKALAASPEPVAEENARLEREAAAILESLESLESSLRLEITGVQDSETSTDKEVDLEKQLRQVVRPALDFLDDIMKQPRELDELRRSITRRDREIPQIERALTGLDATMAEVAQDPDSTANSELHRKLDDLAAEYRRELDSRKAERTSLQRRLDDVMSQRKGFGHYAARLWSRYVLERLLNLLLAILAFGGVLASLMWLHRWFGRRGFRRRFGISALLARVGDVCYYTLAALAALAAGFLVLWASGDWLLLTLGMLMVAGLVLLSRRTLPHFYSQARLMLNLGPIREGERVTLRGLPWLVKRLHFHCELVNPSLTGGTLHLPLSELENISSRAFSPRERWFPTEEGDWVELSDGTVGKVVLQSPESVQILPVGGSFRTFPATDFLARSPRNLSHNFRVLTRFLLDLRHAPDATTTIPLAIEAAVRDAVSTLLPPDQLLHLKADLSEVSPSGIEFLITADFAGAAAPHFSILPRVLRSACATAAFHHNWTIPFRQIVIVPGSTELDAATAPA